MVTNESEYQCVLVVDDDTITLRFFEAAFRAIGVACMFAEDGASAREASQSHRFDLLLIDRNLPDTSGPALLQTLRENGTRAPAIATSADVDACIRSALMQAGFVDVIAKPVGVQTLRDVVATYVTLGVEKKTPLLDDSAALGALGGDATSLAALRTLLAHELDALQRIRSDGKDFDSEELNAKLHRLRASCGFCGAPALAEAARTLQAALQDRARDHRHDLAVFLESCAATAMGLREASVANR